MNKKDKEKYKFIRFSEDYKSKVIRLLSEEWNYSTEMFQWKFFKNPFSDKIIAYVALLGEEVVGFRGFIPLSFSDRDYNFQVLSLTDGYISQNHRRKKLFTLLNKFAIEDLKARKKFEFIYSLSSVDNSTQAYLKSGWLSSGKKQVLFYRNFDYYFFGKLSIPKCFRKLSSLINSSKYSNKIMLSRKALLGEMIKLHMKISHRGLKNSKTFEYLSWRLKNPSGNYYYSYFFNDEGKLLSYVILDKKTNEWRVLDYEYLDIKTGKRHFNYLGNLQIKSLISINDYSSDDNKSKELKKLGFKLSPFFHRIFPKYFKSRSCSLPFVYFPLSDKIVFDEKIWNINLIDDDGS